MKIFIFEGVDGLTNSYHDGGGLVIVAKDLDEARAINPAIAKIQPDMTYELKGDAVSREYIFPDSGCC